MRSKKAIKNIIASLGQQFVAIICGLILPRAIIGAYGSNVNGLVSSITQFLAYITLLESRDRTSNKIFIIQTNSK